MRNNNSNSKYHSIAFLLLLVFVSSCKEEKSSLAPVTYHFMQFYKDAHGFQEKKIVIDAFEFHDDSDSLIWKKNICIGGGECELRTYSNCFHAGMDGDAFCIEISGYGVIFESSLSWNSFRKLRSSNDSLNRVFDHALDYALIYAERNDLYARLEARNNVVKRP